MRTLKLTNTSDLQFRRRGFESWTYITAYWPLTSYVDMCASVTKQYNLVLANAW